MLHLESRFCIHAERGILLKLSRWQPNLKHLINLGRRAILHIRYNPPGYHNANSNEADIDKTDLTAEIGGGRVVQIGQNGRKDNSDGRLYKDADALGLGTKA